MKIKIFTTIIAVTATMSLALLSGCSQSNTNKEIAVNTDSNEENEVNTDFEENYNVHPASLSIKINDNAKFNDQLIREIWSSKESSKEDEEYGVYFSNKISDIKECYNLENVRIEGYKLCSVSIAEPGIGYYYTPINDIEVSDEERIEIFNSGYDTGLKIVIGRADYKERIQPGVSVADILKETAEINEGSRLTDDNFVYDGSNFIFASIGNSIFSMTVPYKLANYESLRDLAFEVIKNAELVDVEKELKSYVPKKESGISVVERQVPIITAAWTNNTAEPDKNTQ